MCLVAEKSPPAGASLAVQALVRNLKWLRPGECRRLPVPNGTMGGLGELWRLLPRAARINSLQVIDHQQVPFSNLCSAALVNGCTTEVVLRPVDVFLTSAKFCIDMKQECSTGQ